MGKMNFELKELSLNEQKEINGGNPVFVLIGSAIIGGIIYDAYKAICTAAVNVQVNHPEYYDGPVHSLR